MSFNLKNLWRLTDEELDKYNPPVVRQFITRKGKIYEEVIIDKKFFNLGQTLRPRNKFELFWTDFLHGLLMRYPFKKVLMFSIFHTFGIIDKIVKLEQSDGEKEIEELLSYTYSFGNGQSLSKYEKWYAKHNKIQYEGD